MPCELELRVCWNIAVPAAESSPEEKLAIEAPLAREPIGESSCNVHAQASLPDGGIRQRPLSFDFDRTNQSHPLHT